MISRKTIFSLLLALLVGLGIFAWNGQKRDECDLAGASRSTLQIEVGQAGKTVQVATCDEWLVRQPHWVQGAVLSDVAVGVVFGLSVAWDMQRSFAEKRRLRGGL